MPGRSTFELLGEPSLRKEVAADNPHAQPGVQPNTRPLGFYTGAPPPTQLRRIQIAPSTLPAVCITPITRENRFVTLTAPLVAFTIYIGGADVSAAGGTPLPPGIPYEVSLPGNQALYAISDAPIYLRLSVQIAAALSGDLERRL